MIPVEVLKRVRRIQIVTSAIVNDVFAGQYHSAFKGRGIEFEEVREYQPGDDVRTIDWNVTARAGRPFVKSYREERELTVMLVVDVSASQQFGTRESFKSELAAELGATLALSAIQNNDKVGLLLFTDQVETFVAPRKGLRHVLRVIRELLYFPTRGRGTRMDVALDYLDRVLTRRAVVFVISDFQSPDFLDRLRILKRRHDLIPVWVRDQREQQMPAARFVELYDAELGRHVTIDLSRRSTRLAFEGRAAKRRDGLRDALRRIGVDVIEVQTGESFIEPLRRFFRQRGVRR